MSNVDRCLQIFNIVLTSLPHSDSHDCFCEAVREMINCDETAINSPLFRIFFDNLRMDEKEKVLQHIFLENKKGYKQLEEDYETNDN